MSTNHSREVSHLKAHMNHVMLMCSGQMCPSWKVNKATVYCATEDEKSEDEGVVFVLQTDLKTKSELCNLAEPLDR